MLNFKKYRKFGISLPKAFALKFIGYIRNHLNSKKFNNSIGKSVKLIDFVNYLETVPDIEVVDDSFYFKKKVGGSEVNLSIRKETSDPFVYNQIIEQEEYRFLIDYFDDKKKEYVFMDFGANIGLTSLYLCSHFSQAKVFSFEPEVSNYKSLLRHIQLNPGFKIEAFNLGIYTKDTTLYEDTSFRDGELWSFKLVEEVSAGKSRFEVNSLKTILESNTIDEVDFMKIDIEGGELALLKDKDFLEIIGRRVKVIMMEIHSEVVSSDLAKSIIRDNEFLVFDVGGSVVGINKKVILNS